MPLSRLASRGLDTPRFATASAPRHTSRHSPSALIRSALPRGSQGSQSKARFGHGGATSSPSSSSSPSLSPRSSSSSLKASDREEGAHSLPAYIHPPIPVEAIATHPHYRRDKSASPPQMKNAHRLVLFALYASAATALAGAFSSPAALPSTAAAASLLGTVWLSFVLAISFTEAWVKFRAPTLTKAAAVDAGRHVFAALNAVEGGLAAGLVAALFLLPARPAPSPPPLLLLEAWRRLAAVPLAALALQVGWLTPSLDRRARELIVSSWRKKEKEEKEEDDKEEKARAAVLEMEARDGGTRVPPGWLHGVYVALEAVKVVSLALLVKSAGRGGAFV